MSKVPYRAAVGVLLYLSTTTRPDISFAVGQVAKFCSSPQPAHWKAVKRIFAYLKGTSSLGLWLGGTNDAEVTGYTDADYAMDTDDRKSTSGSAFFYCGGLVSWSSRKQEGVSLSTTEAEYVALSEGAKEAIWIANLNSGLKPPVQSPSTDQDPTDANPVKLYCDNQSAISLVNNPVLHRRSKHIDVRFHFVRKLREEKKIDLQFVGTECQLADIFTKPLPGPRFIKLREKIGMGTFID